MVQVKDGILQSIVNTIVREVDPERVYLFGSRARGEGRADSDVDLLILEREPFGPARRRFDEINRIYRALKSFRVAMDILVYSMDEARKWANTTNHVVARALREGRLLHERS